MKITGGVNRTGSSFIGEQLGGTIGLTKLAGGGLCTLQCPGQSGAAGKYCRVASNEGSLSASKPISGATELAKFSSTWLGHCMGPSSVNEEGTGAKVCCRVGNGESAAVDMGTALTAEIEMEIRALSASEGTFMKTYCASYKNQCGSPKSHMSTQISMLSRIIANGLYK